MSDENNWPSIPMLWLMAATGFGLATFALLVFDNWAIWAMAFSIGIANSVVAVIRMRQEDWW